MASLKSTRTTLECPSTENGLIQLSEAASDSMDEACLVTVQTALHQSSTVPCKTVYGIDVNPFSPNFIKFQTVKKILNFVFKRFDKAAGAVGFPHRKTAVN